MPDVEVLILADDQAAGGLVNRGATGGGPHAGAGKVISKVIKLGSDQLVDSVTKIANAIGPSLQQGLKGLSSMAVQEVSIGCTIGADGSILIAGVGAEASLTITFR